MKFYLYNKQRALSLSMVSVRKSLIALYSFLSVSFDELSVYFVTDREISKLHGQFFNDPTPTDCIAFPMDPPKKKDITPISKPHAIYLGDLFVCPAAAMRYSAHDPYPELLLYLVHSSLHLLGYDDLNSAERRKMQKMEKKCMDHLDQCGMRILPVCRM